MSCYRTNQDQVGMNSKSILINHPEIRTRRRERCPTIRTGIKEDQRKYKCTPFLLILETHLLPSNLLFAFLSSMFTSLHTPILIILLNSNLIASYRFSLVSLSEFHQACWWPCYKRLPVSRQKKKERRRSIPTKYFCNDLHG